MWDTDKQLAGVLAIGMGPPPKDRTRAPDLLADALAAIHAWRLTAMRGSNFVPPEVMAALEFIVDAGAFVRAGNENTELILRLQERGELRQPRRSWSGRELEIIFLGGA